ncbi:MAG: hypothetical protein U1A72_14130 [Sulfuritalea sp.]|nr:hypothetical protein [Sulfuritalea sp.]
MLASSLKRVLRRYPAAHSFLHGVRWLLRPDYRRQHRVLLKELEQFRIQSGDILSENLGNGSRGTAIVMGWSRFEQVLAESVIRKAFELADYRVHVVAEPTPAIRAVYGVMGVTGLETFSRYCPLPDHRRAGAVLDGVSSFAELIDLKWGGVAVGKYVSSTLMRQTRNGSLDLGDPMLRERVVDGLAESMAFVEGAERMINRATPTALVLLDRGYSPYGEIFDACVNRGIPVYTWNAAHRDNTLMLKRYHPGNRDAHPSSLSPESWRLLLDAPWGERERERLNRELAESYNSGEWYGEVGTQFGKRVCSKEEIAARLGLDPRKKTVVVFSHIFWDATFFWGEDLFRDYEDWFVETVRAACANDRLNWLIKVHPANLIKDVRDGFNGEPSEVLALRERIGRLPAHVRVIPADTDITTLSLFEVTDYCLTVRGTVGMEAALLGRNVITAGTGRYDRHGFTTDFNSREDYLARLATLEELGPPTPLMRERAERYGYGVFMCRPVRLKCLDFKFSKDAAATLVTGWTVRSVAELRKAPELVTIADWLRSGDEDYLVCPDTVSSSGRP